MPEDLDHDVSVVEIRQDVAQSQQELMVLIAGPLSALDPALLYQAATPDEWTMMENLAHILEFLPYWADQIAQLVAEPGRNFGRISTDERRLRAIEDHKRDSLADMAQRLPAGFAQMDQVLSTLKESDLAIQGHHSKFGDQTLAWFINDFVTGHLTGHLQQINASLPQTREHQGSEEI